jgi:hypothetical protein
MPASAKGGVTLFIGPFGRPYRRCLRPNQPPTTRGVSEVGSSLLATGYQQVRSVVAALAGDRAGAAQRDQGPPAAAMSATNRDLLAIASRRQLTPSVPERSPVRRRPAARRSGAHRAVPGIDQPASFRDATRTQTDQPGHTVNNWRMVTRSGGRSVAQRCSRRFPPTPTTSAVPSRPGCSTSTTATWTPSDLLDVPLAEQLGGLPAPAVLGTEDPKRVERHGQSPPKDHPNRPECSTATERPDANQEQVDHHVGEEDTVERLPGRPGRPSLVRSRWAAAEAAAAWAG